MPKVSDAVVIRKLLEVLKTETPTPPPPKRYLRQTVLSLIYRIDLRRKEVTGAQVLGNRVQD